MSRQQGAAAGIEAASKAIVALAEGDNSASLAVLNATSHGEAVWAATYLLQCLKEAVSAQVNHDPRRLELALKNGASGAAQDVVETQVGLIVAEELRRQ